MIDPSLSKQDQMLLLVATGEASPWDSVRLRLLVELSPAIRHRYRQFRHTSNLFRVSLGGADNVEIDLKRRRLRPGRLGPAVLLAVLGVIAVVEWGSYTLPALNSWMTMLAHSCGLR